MKLLTIILICFSFEYSLCQSAANCQPEKAGEPVLYSNDFSWNYNLLGLQTKFIEMYKSPKRLKGRAFIDDKGQIILPYDQSRGGPITVTKEFVQNVAKHIEQGFQKNIIDGVFFPDMGHSHLFVPQNSYDNYYSKFEPNQFSQFYQKLFADQDLKILYHTAEQLQTRDDNGDLIQDPAILNRYSNRNLVGPNNSDAIFVIQNPQSLANTAHDLAGHHYWGAGFNLSAQSSGCFTYQKAGVTYNFDISMYDLESSDSGGDF